MRKKKGQGGEKGRDWGAEGQWLKRTTHGSTEKGKRTARKKRKAQPELQKALKFI